MTVKELKKELNKYDNNKEIVIADWENDRTFNFVIGESDAEEESNKLYIILD